MASVEAGGTRSRGGDEYGHFQGLILPTGSPAPCSGSTTRISTGSAAFWPPLLDARTVSQETVGRRSYRMPWLAVGLAGAMASAGPLAGMEDQMATNLAWPTSSSESCTWPMRSTPRPRPWRSPAYP